MISVKNRFQESIDVKTKFDIGIISALENPELKEIIELPCNWKKIEIDNDPNVYHEGSVNTINGHKYRLLACSINKMGMQATASVASMLIAKFKLKYLFMNGICAGIKERDLEFGDIVIAENLTDYGSGKMTENSKGEFLFKPEPHQYPTDQTLIAKVNDFIRNNKDLPNYIHLLF